MPTSGGTTAGGNPWSYIQVTIDGQVVTIAFLDSYAGAPAPLVLYHHGAGETGDAIILRADKFGVRDALLDAGYNLLASDAHGNNWGNLDALADYVAAYTYAIGNGYPASKVFHLGQSMGGLSSLLTVAGGQIPADGCAEIAPVCSLRSVWNHYFAVPGSLDDQIELAYGIAHRDTADYEAKTVGHDPYLLPASFFARTPLRFYASPNDDVIDYSENSVAFKDLVKPGSIYINTLRICSGGHTAPSQFQPTDLVLFFGACRDGVAPRRRLPSLGSLRLP